MAFESALITGSFLCADGTVGSAPWLHFRLSAYDTQPGIAVARTDRVGALSAGGAMPASFRLAKNTAMLRGSYYDVFYSEETDVGGARRRRPPEFVARIQVGDADEYTITELLDNPVPPHPGFNVNLDPAAYAALQARLAVMPVHFASRAVAESTDGQTGAAQLISIFVGDHLCDYVADPAGAALLTGDGRTWRPVRAVSPLHYDTSCSQAAVDAMIADLGYVRFAPGNTAIAASIRIEAEMHFDPGAYLTIASGVVLTLTGKINSPVQHIFRGAGLVELRQNPLDAGEDVRQVHGAWWGLIPSQVNAGDQAPILAKINTAMGNTREGIIHLEMGNFWLGSNVALNRAIEVRGAARRKTVFKIYADGYIPFTSANILCRVSDCNFEMDHSVLLTRVEPFVQFTHAECSVERVRVGPAKIGLDLAGQSCWARDITSYFGDYPGAGSSLVRLRASECWTDRVRSETSTAYGPDYLVDVVALTGSADSIHVSDLMTTGPSGLVRLLATGGNLTNVQVDVARGRDWEGAVPDWCVDIVAENGFDVENFKLRGIDIPVTATNGIRVQSDSAGGGIRGGVITDTTVAGTTGIGIALVQNVGVVEDVIISPTVQIRSRAVPLQMTGLIARARIAPGVVPNTAPPMVLLRTMADDTEVEWPLGKNVFVGSLNVAYAVAGASPVQGTYGIRAAAPPQTATTPATTNVTMTTSDLNVASAVDGQLTVCVLDQKIKVINRLGGTRFVQLALTSGAE
jgi:hypothetical protein